MLNFILLIISLVVAQKYINVKVDGTKVSMFEIGPKRFETIIIGIPGKGEDPSEFAANVVTALKIGNCSDRVKVAVLDLGNVPYNLLEKTISGSLNIQEVVDGVAVFYQPFVQNIIFAGFSKGGQAVERYSLVHSPFTVNYKFFLGCASSWTLLDPTIDYRYGLNNLPFPYTASKIMKTVKQNRYLIGCGANDTGSQDEEPDAVAQGAGRVDRAITLFQNLKLNNIAVDIKFAPGVTHNDAELIPQVAAEYFCTD